jgi:antitoxin PrlF
MPTILEKTSQLTATGQTTVPKPVRDALGIGPGDRIAFRVDERGVTLHRADDEHEDPVIGAFLHFLAKDMEIRPQTIAALSPTLVQRIAELVEGVDVDPDEDIEGDVAL